MASTSSNIKELAQTCGANARATAVEGPAIETYKLTIIQDIEYTGCDGESAHLALEHLTLAHCVPRCRSH